MLVHAAGIFIDDANSCFGRVIWWCAFFRGRGSIVMSFRRGSDGEIARIGGQVAFGFSLVKGVRERFDRLWDWLTCCLKFQFIVFIVTNYAF